MATAATFNHGLNLKTGVSLTSTTGCEILFLIFNQASSVLTTTGFGDIFPEMIQVFSSSSKYFLFSEDDAIH